MDENDHLSKMDTPYVGIREKHTDIFKMDKNIHLGELDVFDHLEK